MLISACFENINKCKDVTFSFIRLLRFCPAFKLFLYLIKMSKLAYLTMYEWLPLKEQRDLFCAFSIKNDEVLLLKMFCLQETRTLIKGIVGHSNTTVVITPI